MCTKILTCLNTYKYRYFSVKGLNFSVKNLKDVRFKTNNYTQLYLKYMFIVYTLRVTLRLLSCSQKYAWYFLNSSVFFAMNIVF